MGMAEKQLCATCGRVAYCDEHHAMGRAHTPGLTVPACAGSCHPVLNEKQAASGVVLDHDQVRSAEETAWAFLRGTSDPLALMAFHHPDLGPDVAARDELSVVALGRLYDLVARPDGGEGVAGPSPRRNDVRAAGRRGRREDRSTPSGPTRVKEPHADRARIAQMAKLISDGVRELPQADALGAWPEEVAQAAQACGRSVEMLQVIEEAGGGENYMRVVEHGLAIQDALNEQIAVAAQLSDLDDRTWTLVKRTERLGDLTTAFMRQLADCADLQEARELLDRFVAEALAV